MTKIRMLALASQNGVYGTYSGLVTPDANGYVLIDERDFATFSNSGFVLVTSVSYPSDPGMSNDSTQGYFVGFLWINNSTLPRVWLCISNAARNASWILLYQQVK